MTTSRYLSLIAGAAGALKARKEEVNRLNVFPVPDGDTGTNMSLTMDVVVDEVAKLAADADIAAACHAITHGSLMGARGNSGVILSQILRGLCEALEGHDDVDTELLATALERSVTVAFQAVRKPVEGTILTVLRDTAEAARVLASNAVPLTDALPRVSAAAFDSVKRTPELLEVLKDNGVVDAGGFGLAILFDGFVAAALGTSVHVVDVTVHATGLKVVPVDDWEDTQYLYCTEFLLFGEEIDPDAVRDYVSGAGGSELVVGSAGEFKVHVHTNDPGSVLSHMTELGEVSDVHIHNMRRQTEARDAIISAEQPGGRAAILKPVGFVAVAAGSGLADILRSLGVDVVVSGGQTMNPSTKDLADAINSVPAEQVIVLPNNKNIQMAATAAASVAERPTLVVPTTSVPQAFSAMLAYDAAENDLDTIAQAMEEAAAAVRTGEVTVAVKNAKAKAGAIKAGQVIGIADHEIEVVGDEVEDVASKLAEHLLAQGAETLTVLAGEELSDQQLAALLDALAVSHPDTEIESHRGDQPLYPVIMAAE
jgi:DAK2 domain fusion protein YloV